MHQVVSCGVSDVNIYIYICQQKIVLFVFQSLAFWKEEKMSQFLNCSINMAQKIHCAFPSVAYKVTFSISVFLLCWVVM